MSRSGKAHKTRDMFYVYVLYSESYDKNYVGVTNDLARRLYDHNLGRTPSTKAYVQWRIVHTEIFDTFAKAHEREKFLKTFSGRRWRKENIRPRGATE